MVLYPHSITTMTTCSVCNFMIQSRLLKILGMHLVCIPKFSAILFQMCNLI